MTAARWGRLVAVLLGAALPSGTAGAQEAADPQPPPAPAGVPRIVATPRDGGIDLDGRIVEAAWQQAVPASRFVQREPVEGAPAEEITQVWVLYDERALYVAALMRESQMEAMGTQLVRRDEWGQYDYFEVSLDPNNDRRTGYLFLVSAAGVQADAYLFDDVEEDRNWDAVWESSVHRDSSGWSVEMRIPLSQILYRPSTRPQSWGVNFARRRLAQNERTYFALESRVQHGRVSVFGRLQGLELSGAARRIEIQPYALGSARTAPAVTGDPFFDGAELGNQVGADLRYGVGQSTFDVTINPDFGQVEVDPAVINLSAFETFFPEKRPFFVEDAQLFDFGRLRLFNSRRIGREPRGSAPDDALFERAPEQTTILAALKFTSRTPSGLTLGGLAALTDEEHGRALLTGGSDPVSYVAEPMTQYGVIRLQQDFRDGATQVGGILTGVHRNLPASGSLDFLTTSAFSGAIDFEHNWGGPRSRNWALWGFYAHGQVFGREAAILDLQEASNHYYQRPDATRFGIDSTRTSLGGRNWRLQFERRSADHWTGALWLAEVSSGFEINDLGFWNRGERLDGGARLSYQEITPGSLLRSYRISAFTFQNWSHEALDDVWSWNSWKRAHRRGTFSVSTDLEFLNYWGVELQAQYRPNSMSDNATRGGPLMKDPGSIAFEFGATTDRRKPVVFEPSFNYENRRGIGHGWWTSLEVGLRPTPAVEIELEPSFSSELNPAQYVATTDDMGYAPTFGPRYLFADLRLRTFAVEARANVTLNPKLSFALFAQPLLSSGDYLTYKQLDRAESFAFDRFQEGASLVADDEVVCLGGRTCVVDGDRYVDFEGDGTTDFSFDDRDFNVRSFRMTAVMRWEYRPGSTIFLVWQQQREGEANTGSFDFFRDFGALWSTDTENLFIVKLTYWLGL